MTDSVDHQQETFDFDATLTEVLSAIDIGPHCSCAEITLAILERRLPLGGPLARCAAAAFGGGVGGSGGPCGAFAAGLVAMGLFIGERDKPAGCIAETVERPAQLYYDQWMAQFGSIRCPDLSGFPSLKTEEERDAFVAGGGPERCTGRYIKFAAQNTLRLLAQD